MRPATLCVLDVSMNQPTKATQLVKQYTHTKEARHVQCTCGGLAIEKPVWYTASVKILLIHLASELGLSMAIPKGDVVTGRSSSLDGRLGEERVEDAADEEVEPEEEIEGCPILEGREVRFRGR